MCFFFLSRPRRLFLAGRPAPSSPTPRTLGQLCLDAEATIQLESTDEELVTVSIEGTIESTLNVTAGTEGGRMVWQVEEVVKPFSEEVGFFCLGLENGTIKYFKWHLVSVY